MIAMQIAPVHWHANEFCPMEKQLISLCGDKNGSGSISQKHLAIGLIPMDHEIHFVTV